MATILFVEPNPHTLRINAELFTAQGYRVLYADCLAKASDLLLFHAVDLLVLDVLLPDGGGLAFCKQVKEQYRLPILFLSECYQKQIVLAAFRAGADDYLQAPCDVELLSARIEARLRAAQPQNSVMQLGALQLDTLAAVARYRGQDLQLTPKEFALLSLLSRQVSRVVPKADIYQSIWGTPALQGDKALWSVMSRLKKKLDAPESGISISFARPDGYLLELMSPR